MNDYPKFGVWGDGYYMSINQFTCTVIACQWAGQGVAAFPRTQMLAGAAASMVYFDMGPVDDTLGGMLPSDLDGPPPPAGTPNYFVQFDDDAWGYSGDQLQIWEFKVNWTTPTSSTFTRKASLPTAAFDSDLCNYGRSCIRQAGSSIRLDAISDRVMYRLQYRNFGAYQTLVTNHTVDVNGSDLAGIRWYEIRLNAGTPSILQQGTFAPDANSRWMASAAMDSAGNIAMGYNVSSAVTFPRISFTGRKASDPPGQMTLAEGDIMLGTGGQTHSASRWGDYSLLGVDPSDGCTFWFTTEYYQNTSSAGWQTRVGAFRIEGCGGGPAPVVAPTNLRTTTVAAAQVALQWDDNSSDETSFHIERCTGSGCSNFGEIGTTGANVSTFTDTPAANTYLYRVRASRSGTFSSYSNTVTATVPSTSEPPAGGTMHVGSLTGAGVKAGGPNWQAVVTIKVVDGSGAPVTGAVVSGAWTAGTTGSAACTTAGNGTCTVTSPKANSKNVGSITYTVNGITHASLTYTAGANVASSVMVNKP
jgi:hypothetical protein